MQEVLVQVEVELTPRQRRQAARGGRGGRRQARRVPELVKVDVIGNYFPGSPGHNYGPWEDCYPADDADAEVLSARWEDAPIELTDEDEAVAIAAILSGE